MWKRLDHPKPSHCKENADGETEPKCSQTKGRGEGQGQMTSMMTPEEKFWLREMFSWGGLAPRALSC